MKIIKKSTLKRYIDNAVKKGIRRYIDASVSGLSKRLVFELKNLPKTKTTEEAVSLAKTIPYRYNKDIENGTGSANTALGKILHILKKEGHKGSFYKIIDDLFDIV